LNEEILIQVDGIMSKKYSITIAGRTGRDDSTTKWGSCPRAKVGGREARSQWEHLVRKGKDSV
jgi:hypothetical protein